MSGQASGTSGQSLARSAALLGILGGVSAIGGGLYAHFSDPQPTFGVPGFLFIHSDYVSGVHLLVGLGIVMVIGGLLAFRWPAVGICIVCAGAMLGLIATYDKGPWRWTPYVYYWAAPWVFAWVSGIFAGLSLQESITPYGAPGGPPVESGEAAPPPAPQAG